MTTEDGDAQARDSSAGARVFNSRPSSTRSVDRVRLSCRSGCAVSTLDELVLGIESVGMGFVGIQRAAEVIIADLLKVHQTARSYGWHDQAVTMSSSRTSAWQVHGAAAEGIDVVNQVLVILRPLPGWNRSWKRARDLDRVLLLLNRIDQLHDSVEESLTRAEQEARPIRIPHLKKAFEQLRQQDLDPARTRYRQIHQRLWHHRWHRYHVAVLVTGVATSAWLSGVVALRPPSRYLHAGVAAALVRGGWMLIQGRRMRRNRPA